MIRFTTLVAACLALAGAAPARAQTDIKTVTVHVETGALIGIAHEQGDAFRNIPYAAPPVGELRWRPPQPASAWAGDRIAVLPGVSCPQPMNANGTPNLGSANGPTSEDCLQLNVFAPKTAPPPGKPWPVMVWLHGGGYTTGASWVYDGLNFARDGVVVVTVNYRLGALGWFAHPALTKAARPGEAVGNYGLMDQIAALTWVQRNAAAFGGDPRNVTIFGESAGGGSVLALLATPSAKGLYQKAIVESGGGWSTPVTLADKTRGDGEALAKIGVTQTASLAELRAIPVEKLAPLVADYGPFIDGRLMTETPAQALARGHAADVPLIIGSNSGEDSLMGFSKAGADSVDRFPAGLKAAYSQEAAAGADVLARAMFTDQFMGAPARWIAAHAARGKAAWLYYFSYVGSRFRPGMTRAAHAAEIQYAWEYWGRRTPMSAVSAEDRAMAAKMHGCWVAFARTGKPVCGTEVWPPYSPKADQLMEFGSPGGVETSLRKSRLDAQEKAMLPDLNLQP